MKTRTWLIIILIIVLAVVAVFVFDNSNKESELEKLPSLMDASGKIELEVGDFKLDKQPYLGSVDAPVKVIEFLDYKCPACKNWEQQVFPQFKQQYIDTGKVQFYTINFPFLAQDSIEAAVATELIYKQNPDTFWEFKAKLIDSQAAESKIWATEKFLLQLVKDHFKDIDYELFEKDLKNHELLFEVKEDFKIAAANGVYGTPSFIVNGVKVSPKDLENEVLKYLQ